MGSLGFSNGLGATWTHLISDQGPPVGTVKKGDEVQPNYIGII